MPAEFAVDDAGRVTCYIADAQAEAREYEVQVLTPQSHDWPELAAALVEARFPPNIAVQWACRLVRIDTEAVHYVARLGPARFFCSCGDKQYRKRKSGLCKHEIFGRSFYRLCLMTRPLSGVPA